MPSASTVGAHDGSFMLDGCRSIKLEQRMIAAPALIPFCI